MTRNSSSSTCFDEAFTLPVELWEKILKVLLTSPRSMIAASQVCRRWRHLIARICKKYCMSELEDKLLVELLETIVIHEKCCSSIEENAHSHDKTYVVNGEEWIHAFSLYHETCLNLRSEERLIVYTSDDTCAINSEDPFLCISAYDKSHDESTTFVFGALDFPRCHRNTEEANTQSLFEGLSKITTFQTKGKVLKTCLLALCQPVFLVITSSNTKAVVLPSTNGSHGCIRVADTNPRVKVHPKTSSEGNFFVTQDSENGDFLLLYQASLDRVSIRDESKDDFELRVALKCRFETQASSYTWILSRGTVTTMETSGHIRTYKIHQFSSHVKDFCEGSGRREMNENDVRLVAESNMKKDLRYPNPTFFTKDYIFSSTIVSTQLLGYWHMDRDRDFWLVGNTSSTLQITNCQEEDQPSETCSTIRLHQVKLGQGLGQVVTAVHLQRGILLCGTEEGHLIGYKMSPTAPPGHDSFDHLSDLPWLNVTGVASGSISRLGCVFTAIGLLVAVGREDGRTALLYLQRNDLES